MATLIHNVNCQKRNQMIKPQKLFPLPQDKFIQKEKPKSTKDQFEWFKEKVAKAGVKI